jgi:protein-tyrosine phosphatase
MTADPGTFRVLFVCTGNICRSPFAEVIARHLFADAFPPRALQVSSAGTGAVEGHAIHPMSRAELAPWGLEGVSAETFVARQLERSMVAGADVVLGMTTEHRAGVLREAPMGLPYTFSLLEFARLAAEVDPSSLPADQVARAKALVPAARNRRGMNPAPPPGGDDIPDPIGRPAAAYRQAAAMISDALERIAKVLAG